MAKERYKIPTTLDVTYFDMEFNLKNKDGLGVKHPVTAKVILFSLVAFFAWIYLITQTFVGKGGIPYAIGFTIAWLVLSVLLCRSDNTRRLGLELVFSMINYIPKTGRYVPVRMSDVIHPLRALYNIRDIDPEDGCIHFLDGEIGYVYHIVGSASSLMFEEDKQMIIDKVDSFYRKLPVGTEVLYDTVYEGHVVEKQLESVIEDRQNLRAESLGLSALLDERQEVLTFAIKNDHGLTSLHQYLVLRAPNQEAIREFENLLYGDVGGQGLMFRAARALGYEDAQRYLRSFVNGI